MKKATVITLRSHRTRMETQRIKFNNDTMSMLEAYTRRKRETVRINLLEA